MGTLRGGVGLGRDLAQARADDHQQVGLGQTFDQGGRHAGAEVAHIGVRAVVDDVLPAERGGHRKIVALGEVPQRGAGGVGPARPSDQEKRPLRPRNLVRHGGDLRGRDLGHRGAIGLGVGDLDTVGQHVLRQRDHHRARTARRGHAEGARHVFRHPRRIIDLRRPLGHAAEHRTVIDFLKALAVDRVAADLSHEQDHRCRILVGDVNAHRRLTGTGATGDHADAGPPGQLAIGLGHVRQRRPRAGRCRG